MCDIESVNHSGDVVTVFYGAPAPLVRCGYHVQRYGTTEVTL